MATSEGERPLGVFRSRFRYNCTMFKVEVEQESDGRWIAEGRGLPGVLVYGTSRQEAVTRAQALALRILAERLERGEAAPVLREVAGK